MDIGSAYINNISQSVNTNNSTNAANKIKNSTNGLGAESSKEELTEAVKSFESYFVEQMLKNVTESFSSIGGENSTSSQYTNYFMDFAIRDVANNIVDRYGNRLTEDLVAQMQRNYGIEDTDTDTSESDQ